MTQTGNAYQVYFTSYQDGSELQCPFGVPEGAVIVFNPGSAFHGEPCTNSIETKNVLNMVEFLYDPTMTSADTRPYSYKAYLHDSIASSYPPLTFSTALGGSHATWLVQDGWELNSVPLCSYSEAFVDGKCRSCPSTQYSRRPNDD